jgi:hypothetical protein
LPVSTLVDNTGVSRRKESSNEGARESSQASLRTGMVELASYFDPSSWPVPFGSLRLNLLSVLCNAGRFHFHLNEEEKERNRLIFKFYIRNTVRGALFCDSRDG